MALSDTQTIELFFILDVPYSDGSNAAGYQTLDAMGTLSRQTTFAQASQNQAINAINTYLSNMATRSMTALAALLDRHIALGTRTTRVEGGNVGDMTQVTTDPNEERELIAHRVRILVPFFQHHQILEREMGATGGSMMIGIAR